MKALDVVLIILLIMFIAFVVMMFITFWRFGMIPDTLCTCFFACIGGECGICGWIKTTKERQTERQWQLEDEKRMEKRMRSEKKRSEGSQTEV